MASTSTFWGMTHFLSYQSDDFSCVLSEDKHDDGEIKVLEVLTYTEKIGGKVVVKLEILDFQLDLCGGDASVVT